MGLFLVPNVVHARVPVGASAMRRQTTSVEPPIDSSHFRVELFCQYPSAIEDPKLTDAQSTRT